MATLLTGPTPPPSLRAHVREHCQNVPGVYRMIGPSNEVIYVGKSIRLRARLLSYFRAERGEKAAEIIGHTHRIDWEQTPSEFASLLLEMRSIRRWRPRYNVEHKRERIFCFVKLSREAAPRLLVVHEAEDDGALYFGPFREPRRVRELVRQVVDLLRLRDCAASTPLRFADQLDLFGRSDTPLCMRADLARCLAPCASRCTRAEYGRQVQLAERFLEGNLDVPIAILRDRMEAAASRLQFEYASQLRDRALLLDAARAELVQLRRSIEALSFVYRVPGLAGDDRVYVIRAGSIRAELPAPRSPEAMQKLREFAHGVLERTERAITSVRPDQAAEALLLARWFRLHPSELTSTWHADAARILEGARLLNAM